MLNYHDFLSRKSQRGDDGGFDPKFLPGELFDFQRACIVWACRKGRAALFEDCGLGKTFQQLVWAENVVRETNGRVLIMTPLAVASQTIREGDKFGIECGRRVSMTGPSIIVTNYERLHHFDPNDFVGAVCDESAILKSFDGVRRSQITEFMRRMKYRLLCTATPSPNEYIELGTSSEALGQLGYMDMLSRFFKNDQGNSIKAQIIRHKGKNFSAMEAGAKWRFKGHAELPFWQWVCSWARACRKPSDLGFNDGPFLLPPLREEVHSVEVTALPDGQLFAFPAVGLTEQRQERRRSIEDRCEAAAALVRDTGKPALMWCHLNDEGDMLEEAIPDAIQVSGQDNDDAKEEKFLAFAEGKVRVLVTKEKIGAWGLNFQHCAHVVSFPTHSFEGYYQSVRRCWRFGQRYPVKSDIVTTEGEAEVLSNLQRKSAAADRMFTHLVEQMHDAARIDRDITFNEKMGDVPWL